MKPAYSKLQVGFSLVELMVALVLGIILTGGVISVYITSKSTYSVNNALGQVEESGRFALNFMQPLVTMGGYTGCKHASIDNLINVGSPTPPVYDFGTAVFGFEASGTGIGNNVSGGSATTVPALAGGASDWSPSLTYNDSGSVLYAAISGSTGGLIDNSDVFMVHEAGSNPAFLIGPTYFDSTSLYIAPSTSASAPVKASDFNVGEFALASTCGGAGSIQAFQISALSATAGTLGYATSGTPGNTGVLTNVAQGYSVQPVQTYVFYIGRGVDKWPALYEAKFTTSGTPALRAQELVSGVENMQVLYGVDTDSPADHIPNEFLTASDVQAGGYTNWNNVVSVRVALVMQSDDNSIDKAPVAATAIHMLGIASSDSVNFTPPVDRRMRRYFVQTFSLRNLLP